MFDAQLLWRNAAPTSDFAEQKISVDLTNYSGVIIEYLPEKSIPTPLYTRAIPIWDGDPMEYIGLKGSYRGGRFCTVFWDGVYFMDGHASGVAANNARGIPLAIYGTNGVVKQHGTYTGTSALHNDYLIAARDKSGGVIKGFTPTLQANDNAVIFCDWRYNELGVGFSMQTRNQTNSYAMMVSNQTFEALGYEKLRVKGWARGYNANDYVGIIVKGSLPADAFSSTNYTYADMASWLFQKVDVVTGHNYTKFFDIELPVDYWREYYLAAMIAGSGADDYPGFICIEEAWLE